MIIHGLNKLTLTDYPGKLACIVFTGHCNFRCPYCHNASLVLNPESQSVIREEEIFSFLKKRKGMLDGVVITGGEPLLNKDIKSFIKKVKEIGYLIKLDTNGSFPSLLKELIDESLVDYVAMDIKNDLSSYSKTIGVSNYNTDDVVKSINLLKEGRVDYEFRTTVVEELHNLSNFEKIIPLITPCKRYFLQSFVASKDTISKNLNPPSSADMKSYVELLKNYITSVEIR